MVFFVWIVQRLFLICTMTLYYYLGNWLYGQGKVILYYQKFSALDSPLALSSLAKGVFSQSLDSSCVTKFAFVLCQKVCVHPMSQNLHLSHVTKFAFILYHKVCVHPLSQSFHSSYVIKFVVPFYQWTQDGIL